MKNLRICNVVCDITSGGVESVIQNYFSHMDRSQYNLDLMTYDVKSETCAKKFENLGFRIIVVPPKRLGFIRSVREMNRVIKNGKYDVVHTHLTEWNCIPMFLAWLNRVPVRISHSHMAAFPKSPREKTLFSLQKCINKIFSNKLVACGDAAAVYLYGQRTVDKGMVEVINNAIDVSRFAPNEAIRKKVRDGLEIREGTLCVGHIGRFLEQKNHTFLIDIFFELQKEWIDSVLLLMGTGDLETGIKKKVSSLGIETKVYFLGLQKNPEHFYQAMDVFCLPSLFEGLPVVGIEAQAANLPCIVSDKVSEEIKLTELVKFVSLNASASEWADAIINAHNNKKDVKIPDSYNLSAAWKQWKDLYK